MRGCLFAFLGLIAIIVVGFVFAFPKLMNESEGAREFANDTIVAVFDEGGLKALRERGSAAMKINMNESATAEFEAYLEQNFGAMLALKGELTCPSISVSVGAGTSASCSVLAEFEKADGTIKLDLIKEGGEWRVSNFRVSRIFGDAAAPVDAET